MNGIEAYENIKKMFDELAFLPTSTLVQIIDEKDKFIDYFGRESKIVEADLVLTVAIKQKLKRWLELLETDGIDSKNMVATDIQQVLKECDGK